MRPDLYGLLEVDRGATPEDLKRAYRKQALRWHPDRNPGDPEAERRFKEVNYAWGVLSDPARRMQYDRFGRVFTDGPGQGPFGADDVDLGEVLGSMFRDLFGGRARPKARRQDLRYTVTISLEEASTGCEKRLRFERADDAGKRTSEQLTVRVPAGVDTGQKLKVGGKGSGRDGDLYVLVNVQEHPYWKRRGADVFCDIPVTLAQAVLGGEVDVPVLAGVARVELPPGTRPGSVVTVKGVGLPRVGAAGRGDQYCHVTLDLPDAAAPDLARILSDLDEATAARPTALRTAFEDVLRQRRGGQESA